MPQQYCPVSIKQNMNGKISALALLPKLFQGVEEMEKIIKTIKREKKEELVGKIVKSEKRKPNLSYKNNVTINVTSTGRNLEHCKLKGQDL